MTVDYDEMFNVTCLRPPRRRLERQNSGENIQMLILRNILHPRPSPSPLTTPPAPTPAPARTHDRLDCEHTAFKRKHPCLGNLKYYIAAAS